jgi:hypothetical protein
MCRPQHIMPVMVCCGGRFLAAGGRRAKASRRRVARPVSFFAAMFSSGPARRQGARKGPGLPGAGWAGAWSRPGGGVAAFFGLAERRWACPGATWFDVQLGYGIANQAAF